MAPAASTSTKKLPRWAWVVAIAGGLVVGFLILRRPSSGGTPAPASYPQDAANGGQPSTASAPADSLDPAVLGALGFSLDTLGTLGGYLAALAGESQQQLGQLAQTTVGASLGLAGQAVQANTDLASSVVGAFGQVYANPVYQPMPIFPSSGSGAPAPRVQAAGAIAPPTITWKPPGGFPSVGSWGGSFAGLTGSSAGKTSLLGKGSVL